MIPGTLLYETHLVAYGTIDTIFLFLLRHAFNKALIYNSDMKLNGLLALTSRKVGGPNDTLAPPSQKVKGGGYWPPSPPFRFLCHCTNMGRLSPDVP